MEQLNLKESEKKVDEKETSESETRKFSKRYSLEGRQKLADEIRELRFQYFKKEEKNPERYESIKTQEREVENLKEKQKEIENCIEKIEEEIENEKAKLWNKIQEFFRKIDIEKELEIDEKKKSLEAIKKEIAERFSLIGETEKVIVDTSFLEEAKSKLGDFYNEQSELKSQFENEAEKRDVETLSKEKGYIFLHGIPTKNRNMNNTAENNPALKTSAMSTEDKLSLLVGLEPTISASVLKEGQQDAQTYYTFGVILGGGKILSAYKEDSGTLAESLYSRRSKYDRQTQETSIQPNIDQKLNEAVNTPVESRNWGKYNEIVVEQPKVAGLYINLSQLNQNHDRIGIGELQKYATDMNLPIYALKDGKLYPFDIENKIETRDDGKRYQKENAFEVDGGELQLGEVIDKRRDISSEEKLELATSVMEKNPFRMDSKQEYDFYGAYARGNSDSYTGRDGYKNLQKAQELYEQRVAAGIEDSDPGTPEGILRKAEDRLEDLRKGKEDAMSNKSKTYFDRDIKKELYSLYGFALSAQESGDTKIFESMKALINEFGSFDDCANLIAKRIDEKGNFKTLDTDIPMEIRQKLTELKKEHYES